MIQQNAIQDKHPLHGQTTMTAGKDLVLEPLDLVVFG